MKNYLTMKMLDNGYIREEFSFLLGKYEVNEQEAIINEIERFFKNHELNKENIAKITKKLLSKGFNYVIIKDVIRECGSNYETY